MIGLWSQKGKGGQVQKICSNSVFSKELLVNFNL